MAAGAGCGGRVAASILDAHAVARQFPVCSTVPQMGAPMEAAYISALAALAGTAIGGLTSFATSWTTQQAQARAQRLAAERDARAALFGRFLEEAAKLYSDALQSRRDDITGLINIYALTNRIRLISSPQVAEAADTVCRMIVDAY